MLTTEVENTLECFIEAIQIERGVSSATISAYLSDLKAFFVFHESIKPEQVKRSHIEGYLAKLYDDKAKTSSVQRVISALRQLFLFLASENRISANPMEGVWAPKAGRSLPKTISEEQVEKLLVIAEQNQTIDGIRLHAMLEVLYASGLRVSELVALPVSALIRDPKTNLIGRIIRVTGKGNKERLAPLSFKAITCLENYLKIREKFIKSDKSLWLWPSRSKQGYLTRQHFALLLKELALQAGIDTKAISPHVLRHAFATHLLKNGADILSIKKLLGHADIATTQIYTHVVNSEVDELVRNHHPLAK